jgi:hypothetical protein
MLLNFFTCVIFEWLQKTRVFVPGRPFQARLIFGSGARAYPGEALLLYGRLYLQTLDFAGKACQGQTLQLITNISKLQTQTSLIP